MTRAAKHFQYRSVTRNVLLVILWCFIPITGCSCTEAEKPAVQSSVAPQSLSLPTVTETPLQIKAEMKKYEPFSTPFEEARLKLLVAWEDIRKREGVEGFQATPPQPTKGQAACLDPASGRIAWRALACFNPDCPGSGKGGGPLLFVRPYKNITVGPDGKLSMDGAEGDAELLKPCVCPACRREEFIRPYDPPETELRNRQLSQEMQSIYAVYHEAQAKGQAVQLPGRTPTEVMTNKSELPKLFLAPEPGQVIEEGRLTVPVSRGLGKP